MASDDVPDYGANETQVDRLRARNATLREREAELEGVVEALRFAIETDFRSLGKSRCLARARRALESDHGEGDDG